MATCSNCLKEIKFDWCHDQYVYTNGSPLDSITKPVGHDEVVQYYICECGKWIGVGYTNNASLTFIDCPELNGTDWENENNRFGG